MYSAVTAPHELRNRFTTLATWTQAGGTWAGVLSADPGFEIAWTLVGDGIHGPCLTPASRAPALVASGEGPRKVRILRIRSALVGPLLGADASDLPDRGPVALSDLGPQWRAAARSTTEEELIAALARVPLREVDPLAQASIVRLGAAAFPQIAHETGYSYAQWRRRMKAATGVSPKFLDRYLRLQRASRVARRHPRMCMGEIALRTGYASDCGLAAESSLLAGRTFRDLVATYTLPE